MLRRNEEQRALVVLSEAQKKLQEEIEEKNNLLAKQAEAMLRREALASQEMTPTAYVLEDDFIEGNKIRLGFADQAINRARKRLDRDMRDYLLTKQRLRSIEILKEKAFDEFRHEENRKELKNLDDQVGIREIRKMRTEADEENEVLSVASQGAQS